MDLTVYKLILAMHWAFYVNYLPEFSGKFPNRLKVTKLAFWEMQNYLLTDAY